MSAGNLKIKLNNGVEIPLVGERVKSLLLSFGTQSCHASAQGSWAPPDAASQGAVKGWILTSLQVWSTFHQADKQLSQWLLFITIEWIPSHRHCLGLWWVLRRLSMLLILITLTGFFRDWESSRRSDQDVWYPSRGHIRHYQATVSEILVYAFKKRG